LGLDDERLPGLPHELFLLADGVDFLAEEGVAFQEAVEVEFGEIDVVGHHCLQTCYLPQFGLLDALEELVEASAHLVHLLGVLVVEAAVFILQWFDGVVETTNFQVEVVLLLELLVAEQAAEVLRFDLLQFVQLAVQAGLDLLQLFLEVQDLLAHLLGLLQRLLAPAAGCLPLLVESAHRLNYLLGHLPDAFGLLLHNGN
jgi:hypothetical protein